MHIGEPIRTVTREKRPKPNEKPIPVKDWPTKKPEEQPIPAPTWPVRHPEPVVAPGQESW